MITRDDIIQEFKRIYDPELHVDIWTMGLIYDIQVKSDTEVHILMTYTTPLCPFGPDLNRQIQEKLHDLDIKTVEIEVTFSPPWKPSEDLRTMLGM